VALAGRVPFLWRVCVQIRSDRPSNAVRSASVLAVALLVALAVVYGESLVRTSSASANNIGFGELSSAGHM
jgi:hypothetical protein